MGPQSLLSRKFNLSVEICPLTFLPLFSSELLFPLPPSLTFFVHSNHNYFFVPPLRNSSTFWKMCYFAFLRRLRWEDQYLFPICLLNMRFQLGDG